MTMIETYGPSALRASETQAEFGRQLHEAAVVHIVDNDEDARRLSELLGAEGLSSKAHSSLGAFLRAQPHDQPGCLVADAEMLREGGLDRPITAESLCADCPVVMIARGADVQTAVVAMKTGAVDFVEKPFNKPSILAAIATAIRVDRERRSSVARMAELRARFATVRPRERQVMALVSAGLMNKQIAFELDLSEITVKVHRGSVMRKMAARSLADLVRIADAVGALALPAAG